MKRKQPQQSRFRVSFPTFSDDCLPWVEPGRSLLVADPRLRFVVGSAFSPILAFSERSDSPFTLVTRKQKDYSQNETVKIHLNFSHNKPFVPRRRSEIDGWEKILRIEQTFFDFELGHNKPTKLKNWRPCQPITKPRISHIESKMLCLASLMRRKEVSPPPCVYFQYRLDDMTRWQEIRNPQPIVTSWLASLAFHLHFIHASPGKKIFVFYH